MALGAIMQAGVSRSLSLLKERPLHWNGAEIFFCPDRVSGERSILCLSKSIWWMPLFTPSLISYILFQESKPKHGGEKRNTPF